MKAKYFGIMLGGGVACYFGFRGYQRYRSLKDEANGRSWYQFYKDKIVAKLSVIAMDVGLKALAVLSLYLLANAAEKRITHFFGLDKSSSSSSSSTSQKLIEHKK